MFDAFLKIEGIDGESRDSKHQNEIEVLSYEWQVEQPATATQSSLGGRAAGRANFGKFTITKGVDKASPKLFLGCASGEHYASARLELCEAGGDKQPYVEYKLTDVMITDFKPQGTRGEGEKRPLEVVSFAYAKIETKYTQISDKGTPSGTVAAGWDLTKNQKV